MKEKILLINPFYEYKNKHVWRHKRIWPPIDLAIVAAMLEQKGFEVTILDLNAVQIPIGIAAQKTEGFDKIFITSGSLDRWQCPHLDIDSFLLAMEEVKKVNPNTKIYIFGPHVTMRPKELLEVTKTDAAIIGEPELTIAELCEKKSLADVDGLAYIEKNDFKLTKPRELADLSKFPIPAFHLLPMKKYNYEIMGDHFTLLETSRGCPFSCIFCAEDQMYGLKYRMKPVSLIEKEIDKCVNEFGVKNIYFIDLEFTLNRDFVNEICDMLIRKGYKINWACQTRADTVDLELLTKMRKAGCTLIHYGLESGSPTILESTNKKITLDSLRQSVEWAKQVGMEVVCFSMMGLPTETAEDMRMTIEFAKEVNPDYISFHVATPYPGTTFYETVKNEVKDLFPLSYEGIYSEEFIRRMTRRAFIEFYIRPKYLLSMLRKSPKLLFRQSKLFLSFIK
jgi:radical SAM superfamily enzyme YgiQ (UPF0313 family)